MNTVLSKKTTVARTAIIDAALLAAACLIPTLSHITALPLYMLNPMLLVLLAGMLAVRSRTNAFLLAVLLPVVSMLAVGMPTPLKALCMAAEMLRSQKDEGQMGRTDVDFEDRRYEEKLK